MSGTRLAKPEAMDRREWLRRCGRYALLGAAELTVWRLASRNQIPLSGQSCANDGVCGTCGRRASCGLPAALSRRQALGGRS